MPTDLYLQPNAPDPVLDDAVVLSLVRRHVPMAQAVTGVDESGGEARTYAVDDRIILKTQRPHRLRPSTSLEKEACFLRHLALTAPDVSVPRVYGYGHEGSVEYTCMSRMVGLAVVNTTLTGQARRETLRAVGTTLRRIHTVDQAPLAVSGLFPIDRTFADLRERVAERFSMAIAKLHREQRPWTLPQSPEEISGRALAALPDSAERVALHTNPGPTHTFVDPVTGAFTGLIDFGDAFIGHPAFDLRQWSRPEDREAVLDGYTSAGPVGADFMDTWHVLMMLTDMITIAYYPERGDEARAGLLALLSALP